MEKQGILLKTDVIDKEISKHRKLIHRAIGNNCLIRINYHHLMITDLIKEKEEITRLYDNNNRQLHGLLGNGLGKSLLDIEDYIILNGKKPD